MPGGPRNEYWERFGEAIREMSHESTEVVRRQFEAFGRGGLEAAAEFWHPEIDWRAVEGAADDVGVMRGAEALRRYYTHWTEAFDELHAEVEEVVFESADRCAVVVRNSGRPRGSSALAQGRYYVVCTVRDGLIASGREYETRDEALEAAGLGQESE
jgi:ketosteroid isomerase-like protein